MKHNWEYKRLGDICTVNFGKRIVAKDTTPGPYKVYGGGGATFTTLNFNRENCTIVSRFAMSSNCVRFVKGKFFLNDSGLTIETKIDYLTQGFIDKFLWVNQPLIFGLGRGMAQKNLNVKALLEINVPVPPMEVQERIVAELDKINETIEDCRELLRNLDALAQSLFYDTFGDPVTNPKGWETKSIQELAITTAGGTPSKSHPEYYMDGNIRWLRSGEVCKMNIIDTKLRITELGLNNCSAKIVPVNSVVVAMYGATASQVGIIRTEMALNQAICAILPNMHTNPIYLYFCLSSLKDSLLKVAHGAAQPNISQAIIKSTYIPVPPLALQEQFAARIEQIEAQKEAVESTIAELQTLLDSRMDYWFN